MKLPAFFILRFQTEERVLRVNKSEITGENAINRNFLEIEDSQESNQDKKNTVLGIFEDFVPVL